MTYIVALIRDLLVSLGLIPRPEFIAKMVSSHPAPEAIGEGCLYVVGESGYKKWAYFRCPADPREIIQLSLMASRQPRWDVSIDLLYRPTLYPSVRQLDGTYAHFWVKKGSIEWCDDTGKQAFRNRSLQDVSG
jgi:hypothetical protein